jgi:hypothetical protein
MSESKPRGCLKPLFIGLLVLFILVIGFLLLGLSGVVTRVANQQLPKQLSTDASLQSTSINLMGGRFGVSGLILEQPEEFRASTDTALLSLGSLNLHMPVSSAVSQNPLHIADLQLSGLDLNLISNTNKVLNVSLLGPKPVAEDVVPVEEIDLPEEPAAVPPVWLEHALLDNIHIAFQDEARDWNIDLSDITFEITNLQITESQGEGPGEVKGYIFFHSEKASGRLQLLARVGVITPGKPEVIPTLQIALGLIGFDLDLVEPFLAPSPTVAKTAFGGSGFDFHLFMQILPPSDESSQEIAGRFELITDRNHITTDNLGGTVAEPSLPFTSLFADILGNQFGRAFNMGGNVAQGGLEAGKTVGRTGVAAAKGVGKTVGGFAGGLLRTAKGVATLDKDEALGGMSDATVGTAKNAAGTVTDTAGTAGSGLADTAGKVTGSDDVAAWWANVEARQEAFEALARAWFAENPFPGSPATP